LIEFLSSTVDGVAIGLKSFQWTKKQPVSHVCYL